MSTTIHHGLKLTGITTLEELDVFLVSLKNKVQPIIGSVMASEITSFACFTYDLFYTENLELFDMVEYDGNKDTYTDLVGKSPLRISASNYYASINEKPFEHSISYRWYDGALYALYFTDNKEVYNAIINHDQVEGFPYWDNTDPPEDMEYEDFEERGEIWKDVLNDFGTANDSMSNFILADSKLVPDDSAMEVLPSKTERARMMARSFVFDKMSKEHGDESVSYYVRHTEEVNMQINDKLKEFKKIIKGKLTLEDIEQELTDIRGKNG